jgi:hypothetical protein
MEQYDWDARACSLVTSVKNISISKANPLKMSPPSKTSCCRAKQKVFQVGSLKFGFQY